MTRTEQAGAARAASDPPAQDAHIQEALYRIAEAASAAQDLDSFYAEMHAIVGELMYAENFYIALFDPGRDALQYPYNVDTVDPEVLDPKVWHQLGSTRLGRGTTAYVLRTGKAVPIRHRHVPRPGAGRARSMRSARSRNRVTGSVHR